MRQLITATLIASALASPVMGELVELRCSYEVFEFNTDDWSGTVSAGNAPLYLELLSESEDHLAWIYERADWPTEPAHVIWMYFLNRHTMLMTSTVVSLNNHSETTSSFCDGKI